MTGVGLGTILIVEDDPGVATLERRRLERAGYAARVAVNAEEALDQLRDGPVDLILLDYRLPDGMDGLEFYKRVRDAGFDLPVILVTGFSSEATVIKALRTGVRDFVSKSVEYLDYLPEAVERVLRQVRTERQLAESEQRFRTMADHAPVFIRVTDADGRCTFVNETWLRFSGRMLEQELGDGWTESVHPDDAEICVATHREAVRERVAYSVEYRVRRADGAYCWVLDSATPRVLSDGTFAGHVGSAIDITERRQAEELIRDQSALLEQARDAIIVTDTDDQVRYWNRGAERLYGWRADEIVGHKAVALLYRGPSPERDAANRMALEFGEWSGELHQVRRDGRDLIVESRRTVLRDVRGRPTARLIINTDVTEKKSLESQFLHAQKLEGIGRLAGGVAHDFNNLLTVITGYSEMVLATAGLPGDTEELIREINKAGVRAAGLTRQLLAFSRKQILQPIPFDLNSLVAETEKMLRRLIGEDIGLTTSLDPALGQVRADPGQIEQVLINLAVNARDAMPQGGKLTLETRNVELDEAYARLHSEVPAGPYVLLAVSDTGVGMDEETRAQIFEPFFTTKPPGRGTGLGLATVYGIVRQSNGHIQVYSEPAHGTTFKIYLPRLDRSSLRPGSRSGVYKLPRGTETVLLVEDEEGVRSLATLALQSLGYTVLQAPDGNAALEVAQHHTGPLDLLVTDVVLPHLGGPQLAARLATLRPGLKVLFVSGYTDDAVVRHGVLHSDMAFLQKPYTPASLARKVREVIDAPSPPIPDSRVP